MSVWGCLGILKLMLMFLGVFPHSFHVSRIYPITQVIVSLSTFIANYLFPWLLKMYTFWPHLDHIFLFKEMPFVTTKHQSHYQVRFVKICTHSEIVWFMKLTFHFFQVVHEKFVKYLCIQEYFGSGKIINCFKGQICLHG